MIGESMKEETFETLWRDGIKAKSEEIVEKNVGRVVFDTESKERIFREYTKLRDYTKISFMRNPDGLLDRHKVCACLIYAIVKSKPLVYDDSDNEIGMKNIFNENLAMTVGLSLLYNFIVSAKQDNSKWIEKGFKFPKTERDATYQELLCLMIYYDIKNNQYSILALSNILFMIEEYTKVCNLYEEE